MNQQEYSWSSDLLSDVSAYENATNRARAELNFHTYSIDIKIIGNNKHSMYEILQYPNSLLFTKKRIVLETFYFQ